MKRHLARAMRARPFPYPRRVVFGAMSLLWAVGGAVCLLIAVLPHPPKMDVTVVAVLGATAPPVAAAIWFLRERLPAWSTHPLLLAGTGIVTVLVSVGGGRSASVSFSFFYLWVVMYALLFFSPVTAAAQIAVAAVAYGAVTASLSSTAASFSAVEPLTLIGVIGTCGVVVVSLARARENNEVDPLTRAANRRGLDRALDAALVQAAAREEPFVLAFLDIDHFKEINDGQGHQAGDEVLVRLADAWRKSLRAGDVLARFGGDEFVVLLPGCAPAEAFTIVERLRAAGGGVTCSVGAAGWQHGDSASMLLTRADAALYEAKSLGRNRSVMARPVPPAQPAGKSARVAGPVVRVTEAPA